MTTQAQLRKAASALPDVEEGTHFGRPAFKVRGKGFVSMTKDGQVQLRLPPERIESLVSKHSGAGPVTRNDATIGARVPLADVDGQELNFLVRASWTHVAPKRLVASLEAAENVDAGDLPAAIGRPATQALHGASLNTLEKIASRTESELLALHGVGPKAVRILREELSARGMSLK